MQTRYKVNPKGYLKDFLERQMSGLTGHIEQCGSPFNKEWWGTDRSNGLQESGIEAEKAGWWDYEQTAYWIDGFVRCAILLQDKSALERASKIIYKVLDNPDESGYLGPKFMKETTGWNRWPHVVFFRACMALYNYNHDTKIIDAITRHYLESPCDYSVLRDVMNVEIMLWLYNINKNEKLLNLAQESYARYNEKCQDSNCDKVALSKKKPYAHGVTYNEYSKLGAILYHYTGEKKYLKASEAAYRKIDKYFMLPGGCCCSNEFLLGNEYYQSYETCDITDYTWSLAYMLKITKKGSYADKIEKCIYNAGFGSVLEDFKALQYFSCANQVISDATSNHNWFFKGSTWMSYAPNPGTECCAGNVNRYMPNFVCNSWQVDGDKIYSLLYGPTEFEGTMYGSKVKITQKTCYPFEDTIRYVIKTKVPFKLYIRIPEWTTNCTINGENIDLKNKGKFIKYSIKSDCELTVAFESEIEEKKSGEGVYFTKGALVYSYPVKERRVQIYKENAKEGDFPAYGIYPDGEWRYAIAGEPTFEEGTFSWKNKKALPSLTVKARVIKNWKLEKRKRVKKCYNLYWKHCKYQDGDFTFTPKLLKQEKLQLDKKEREIKLIPYGLCKLRLTVMNKGE